MSHTNTPAPLPPLVSDEQMEASYNLGCDEGYVYTLERSMLRDIYEADRAKTREVVQALVNSAKMAREAIRVISPIPDDGQRIGAIDAYTGLAAALSSAKSQLNIEPTKS